MDNKKKVDFSSLAKQAEKGTKLLLGKAKETLVKAADQNDDGSFDMQDVSAIAESIGAAAKNTANTLKANIEERNRETELRMLHPINGNTTVVNEVKNESRRFFEYEVDF